ncbi:hypothetical protein KHP57_04785 [Algiphilus sp. NNCM1]|nr:hypothetical protein [Algiphilus acroporae]MCI5104169.1 hypothetical protein [Algiphilus sp.]
MGEAVLQVPLGPNPPGLYRVVNRLANLRSLLEEVADVLDVDVIPLNAWVDGVCAYLHDKGADWRGKAQARLAKGESLRGLYSSNAVWCTLCLSDPSAQLTIDVRPVVDRLTVYYLISRCLIVRDQCSMQSPHRAYEAQLALRRLCDPAHTWVLIALQRQLPEGENVVEMVACLIAIRDRVDARKYASLNKGLGALADMLTVAFRVSSVAVFRNRSTGHLERRGPTEGRHPHTPDAMPEDDGYREVGGKNGRDVEWVGPDHALVRDRPHDDLADDLLGKGIAPDEYAVDNAIHFELEEDPGSLLPLSVLWARARARARHVQMAAQHLPSMPSVIALADLEAIVAVMLQEYAAAMAARLAGGSSSIRNDRLIEMLRVAAIMLIHGCPFTDVRNLVAVNAPVDLPSDYELACSPEHRVWMRAYRLPERGSLAADRRGYDPETWPRVLLPDVCGLLRWVETSAKPFSGLSHDAMRRMWKEHVQPLLLNRGVIEKWTRFDALANALWVRAGAMREGDQLTCSVIFGRNDPSAKVANHYTRFNRSALAARYEEIVRELLGDVLQSLPRVEDERSLFVLQGPRMIPASWAGNDRAPTTQSLAGLVGASDSQCQAFLNQTPQTVKEWVGRHNAITRHTALGLAVFTGMRGVHVPIVDLSVVDDRTRTLLLREKDMPDGRHTRMVVLPDEVYAQVLVYLQHLQALFSALPWLPSQMNVPATKHRDRSAYGAKAYALDLRKTLFFLVEDAKEPCGWRPEQLSGDALKRECDNLTANVWAVDNAGRHFLRTELAARDVPPAVINPLFGHANFGEEAWNRHSALDPVGYRRALGPALEALCRDIGYRHCAIAAVTDSEH